MYVCTFASACSRYHRMIWGFVGVHVHRTICTCALFPVHARVSECAWVRTFANATRARKSLFPSVSEDQRPWPRDHERRLIRYISARELRYFILPMYISVCTTFSAYTVLLYVNISSGKVRRSKDWIKGLNRRSPCGRNNYRYNYTSCPIY